MASSPTRLETLKALLAKLQSDSASPYLIESVRLALQEALKEGDI